MIATLSSPAQKTHPVFHCCDLPRRPFFLYTDMSFAAGICNPIFPYSILNWYPPVSACSDLSSCLPLYWIAILSLPAVICHPVFPSTEMLSCLCLHWFAFLSSPLLNCYPDSACSDFPSCLPLYWIAILSLPLQSFAILSSPLLNSYPVSACSDLPYCLPLYWIAILSLPAVICHPVFPCIQIHPVKNCSDLLYPAFPSLTCLSLTISSFGYHSFYSYPVPALLSHLYVLVSLPCPSFPVPYIITCQFSLSREPCFLCVSLYATFSLYSQKMDLINGCPPVIFRFT